MNYILFRSRNRRQKIISIDYQICETAGDDFSSAIVSVLSHLCDQNSRPATFAFGERLDLLRDRVDVGGLAVFGSEIDNLDYAVSIAFQISLVYNILTS